MPNVGDVADVANLIAQMRQIAIQDIKSHECADITQMYIIINSGSTNVHPHVRGVQRCKQFFLSAKGIVNF